MTTKREALAAALPHLHWANCHGSRCDEAIAAVKAALADPVAPYPYTTHDLEGARQYHADNGGALLDLGMDHVTGEHTYAVFQGGDEADLRTPAQVAALSQRGWDETAEGFCDPDADIELAPGERFDPDNLFPGEKPNEVRG